MRTSQLGVFLLTIVYTSLLTKYGCAVGLQRYRLFFFLLVSFIPFFFFVQTATTYCRKEETELTAWGGLHPHPGKGIPSAPSGHGASNPGDPCSPLGPRSPFLPFFPGEPWTPKQKSFDKKYANALRTGSALMRLIRPETNRHRQNDADADYTANQWNQFVW